MGGVSAKTILSPMGDEIHMPPGHLEWLAKRERTRALREQLAEARRAGKAIRHRDRLRRIKAAERTAQRQESTR